MRAPVHNRVQGAPAPADWLHPRRLLLNAHRCFYYYKSPSCQKGAPGLPTERTTCAPSQCCCPIPPLPTPPRPAAHLSAVS